MFRQVDHNSKTPRSRRITRVLAFSALLLMLPSGITVLGGGKPPITVKDPGVRGGPPNAGGPVAGICKSSTNPPGCQLVTSGEQRVWLATQSTFKQINSVTGTP